MAALRRAVDDACPGIGGEGIGGDLTDAPDLMLMQQAALGDRDAFEGIVLRHGPALFRYARHSLPDAGDAQDAVQETFIAAWRNVARFGGRSSLRTWLYGVLAHKIADLRRTRRARPVDDEVLHVRPAGEGTDPLAQVVRLELREAIEAALAELPARQRECWLLVEVEQLEQRDVARILAITPDAVRGNIFRARRSLSERMRAWR